MPCIIVNKQKDELGGEVYSKLEEYKIGKENNFFGMIKSWGPLSYKKIGRLSS